MSNHATEMTDLFPNVQENCLVFARVVEELLARRRQEVSERTQLAAEWPREWTRSELTDVVYSSYLKLLQGKVNKPPMRSKLLEIADYLECTLAERNRILTACQYAPEQPYLQGTALEKALEVAANVVNYLPVPGFVIGRDWQIHGYNTHFLRLYDLTADEFEAIPMQARNVLHLTFDPTLPIYHRLQGMTATWDYTARLNIFKFKYSNMLCQYEGWYQALVDRLMALPQFGKYWHEVRLDTVPVVQQAEQSTFLTCDVTLLSQGKTLLTQGIHVTLGNFDYPVIVAYIPANEETRVSFAALGLPVPENNWAAILGSST